ncbi:nucleotidyltransferase family protein [Desulfobacterales bacterium HSG17]|nr:nucleotidyltransferase family protein [Desulfobacterales bacterium HSG17]
MRVLLLAAGLGKRLRPLTLEIPKCLVLIKGKPLLEYWLEMIFDAGIASVMINLHYLSEKVIEYLDNSPFKNRVTTVYEKQLLGTAGTLLKNRSFFNDDQILLIHADNFSIFNLNDFIQAHNLRPAICDMTLMTFNTDTPESCGILELDKDNIVHGFHEKVDNPPGKLANGAVYILENSIFTFLKGLKKQKIDFSTEVLPDFIGRIYTFHNNHYHRDIGTPESYKKAQELQ